MTRNYFINGPTLAQVKGASDTAIATLSELGLSDQAIRVVPQYNHLDIPVDAWGKAPPEVQWMLGTLEISMSLVHFDRAVVKTLVGLSACSNAEGTFGQAGKRLGGGGARFAAGQSLVGLNLTSPTGGDPWRFFYAYLANAPMEFPLGTERSIITLNWRIIPYIIDPYNSGNGAEGYQLWDHTLDS